MADKLLHGPKPFDLLVDLVLLLVHHFQKKLGGALLHVGLDLAQGHTKALQRPDHLKGVHLPHKIIPVSVFLLHSRRKQANLVVVKQGVFFHPQDLRKFAGCKIEFISLFHIFFKSPLDYRVTL